MQQLIPQVELAKVHVGASAACRVLGVPSTTYYRHKSAPLPEKI